MPPYYCQRGCWSTATAISENSCGLWIGLYHDPSYRGADRLESYAL